MRESVNMKTLARGRLRPSAAFCLAMVASSSVATAQWTSDHLSVARDELAGTMVGDLALFGGGTAHGQQSSVVDILDTTNGVWTTASLSVARSYLTATSWGNIAAFAGGFDDANQPVDTVDIFDAETGSWTVEHLPIPSAVLAAAGVGGKLIFAGGVGPNGTVGVAQIYDVESKTWSTSPLAFPRAGHAAAQGERRAFFVGGTADLVGWWAVEVFDSVTGEWSVLRTPNLQLGAAATVLGGRLFVSGTGRIVDIYDIENESWTTTVRPVARGGHIAGGAGRWAIFAGGTDIDIGLQVATADVYDLDDQTWMTVPLAEAGSGRALAQNGLVVLFAGGFDQTTGGEWMDIVEIFDPGLGELGTTYCGPANLNSTGQSATMSAFGIQAAAANFVILTAAGMPQERLGMFLTGDAQAFVPFVGGSQGNLCLGGKLGRYRSDVLSSGTEGSFSLQIDLAALPTNPPHQVLAGETWNFQAWFRDANPGPTSNFTEGLSIVFR